MASLFNIQLWGSQGFTYRKLRERRALIRELFKQMQVKLLFLLLPKQEIESSTSSFAVPHFLNSWPPVFLTEAAIDATLCTVQAYQGTVFAVVGCAARQEIEKGSDGRSSTSPLISLVCEDRRVHTSISRLRFRQLLLPGPV